MPSEHRPTKVCTKCGGEKALDGFYKTTGGGRAAACKGCCVAAYFARKPPPRECACGCGESFRPSSKRVRFKYNHHLRGRPVPEGVRRRISASHRGVGCTEAQKRKLGKAQAEAAKRLRNLSAEQERKRIGNTRLALVGKGGHGRAARDNPDHNKAKSWVIESPWGESHRFNNLASWCRKNEHLFDDPNPGAKQPLAERARSAIGGWGKWNGWVLVDRGEPDGPHHA